MGRVEKSKKNISLGLVYQVMYLVFNFIARVVMLKYAGINAVSVNGLLTEVVDILSIAELGVWIAISYHLYAPLAQEDHERVASIMRLFKKTYHVIGFGLLGIGAILCPFMPRLLHEIDVDTGYFLAAYGLVLMKAVIPYFFSYKIALLNADQKNYVYIKTNIIMRAVSFGISIAVLILTRSLLIYLCVEMAYNILVNAYVSHKTDRIYPYLSHAKPLEKQETKTIFISVRRMFVGRLSNKVLNGTDNILISTIVSTVMVGFYTQYSMFTNGFLRLFSQVNDSLTGSIGNLVATEKQDKCRQSYERLTYFFFAAGLIIALCFYSGVGPFLGGIIGKDYLLDQWVLLMITANLFLEIVKMPLWTFFNANGMFKYDQVISVIGCIMNIIISIIFGLKMGVTGILAGTGISLMFMFICKLVFIYRKAFDGKVVQGILSHGVYLVLFAAAMCATEFFSRLTVQMHPVLQFSVNVIGSTVIGLTAVSIPYLHTDRLRYWTHDIIKGRVLKKIKKS